MRLHRARLLVLFLALLPACRRHETAVSAERAVLERRREGLTALVAAAKRGALLPFEKLLVVADERLVAEVIAASLPFEHVIAARYRVSLMRAEVRFEDGLGLVRLDGEASFADRPASAGRAELTVYGGLDVVDLDPDSGILRGRVKIIAVDARRVNVYGVQASVVEELVEALGRERLESFGVLASRIEIPVKVEGKVALPAVGPGEVSIEGATIPVRAAVSDVKAFRGKLTMRRAVLPPAAALAVVLVAGVVAACRLPKGEATDYERRAQHERLRGEFERLAAQDPVVTEALAQGGDVVLGVRPALVEAVFGEVAARYLDQVVLDLPLEKTVHESREVEVGTFLGKMTAGTWTLDVTIHRVQGRLRARPPRVAVAPDNMLMLDVPVVLQEGHGRLTAHFSWDSRSVASVVCHDFDVTRRLEGKVLSREYPVSGALRLFAGPERLRADPEFPPREFRIQVDLTDQSWAEVRAALEDQDKVTKCGLGLDPDALLARIRQRLHEGFDVKLPRSLFRPVDFPAAIRQEVAIEDHRVDLAVSTRALAMTPVAVWFGADVRTRVEAGRASAPPAAASPAP